MQTKHGSLSNQLEATDSTPIEFIPVQDVSFSRLMTFSQALETSEVTSFSHTKKNKRLGTNREIEILNMHKDISTQTSADDRSTNTVLFIGSVCTVYLLSAHWVLGLRAACVLCRCVKRFTPYFCEFLSVLTLRL